jgi:nucleotide-binding universal stress UspA family protein
MRPWSYSNALNYNRQRVLHEGAPVKILLPIDGTKYGGAAVQELLQRPWPSATEVRILSVVHPGPFIPDMQGGITQEDYESLEAEQKRASRDVVAKAAGEIAKNAPGLQVTTAVLEGSPKKEIVEEAARWGADLILLGSHGHGPTARFLLGSVAQAVAIHAPCSVEIVRMHSAGG